jgi:hypothetical protein
MKESDARKCETASDELLEGILGERRGGEDCDLSRRVSSGGSAERARGAKSQ